jgi:hypothetical protein
MKESAITIADAQAILKELLESWFIYFFSRRGILNF